MRQVVLDTETTGIGHDQGHRIIEIGCVELENRRPTGRVFHEYINPEREIDAGAIEVHGITNEFLADKPVYARVHEKFVEFIRGSQLVIHNAEFDVGFMDAEFKRMGPGTPLTKDLCYEGQALDTLALARNKRPGQRNSLDALCKVFGIDNSNRELHGALLDAQLLAEVYLAMTREQNSFLEGNSRMQSSSHSPQEKRPVQRAGSGVVLKATAEESAGFNALLTELRKNETVAWDQLNAN